MVITRHGEGCFKMETRGLSIVVDAPDGRLKPDIALKTSVSAPPPYGGETGREIIGPGEYDISGIEIRGYPFGKNNSAGHLMTAFVMKAEDVSLLFLGNPGREIGFTLEAELGAVDIIFAPPGSAKFVKQLSPKIVVSAYFPSAAEAGKEFEQKISDEERLTIKKKDLPAAGTSYIHIRA